MSLKKTLRGRPQLPAQMLIRESEESAVAEELTAEEIEDLYSDNDNLEPDADRMEYWEEPYYGYVDFDPVWEDDLDYAYV